MPVASYNIENAPSLSKKPSSRRNSEGRPVSTALNNQLVISVGGAGHKWAIGYFRKKKRNGHMGEKQIESIKKLRD